MHPDYQFVFLFDHSSGHAKQRPDGLNATKMNKSFGGKAPLMRTTLIEREAGFLGPYARQLHPGQTQHLVFRESDVGPFWMTPAEKTLNRHDRVDGDLSMKERTKAELIIDLQGKGISTKGKNKEELVALCASNEIAVSKEVQKLKEGWEGKPKGLFQVLWERGFINPNKLKDYTLTEKRMRSEILTTISISDPSWKCVMIS
jgi:hypothetical protein